MQKKEILDLKMFGVRKTIGRALAVILLGAGIYKLTEQTWINSSFHEGNIGMGIVEMIFPIFLCFLWVAGCLMCMKFVRDYKVLKIRGIVVFADIIKTYESGRFPQESLFYVTYHYQVPEGKQYKRQAIMRAGAYKKMHEYGYINNEKIEIVYDPLNPKICYPSVSLV